MTIGREQIQRLSRTADDLAALLGGKAPSILTRRPAETAWAATEVVCHLRIPRSYSSTAFRRSSRTKSPGSSRSIPTRGPGTDSTSGTTRARLSPAFAQDAKRL